MRQPDGDAKWRLIADVEIAVRQGHLLVDGAEPVADVQLLRRGLVREPARPAAGRAGRLRGGRPSGRRQRQEGPVVGRHASRARQVHRRAQQRAGARPLPARLQPAGAFDGVVFAERPPARRFLAAPPHAHPAHLLRRHAARHRPRQQGLPEILT